MNPVAVTKEEEAEETGSLEDIIDRYSDGEEEEEGAETDD